MTSASLDYPVAQQVLDNGLRVIASPDHAAGSVAVNLWYDVGSRHEETGRTGLAHLFEHLMFQGSANVKSAEHFSLLQPAGATVNATTWFDRTNYFEALPAGGLDLALWLEAGIIAEPVDRGRGMTDDERAALVARGIGITNLVNRATARADELTSDELQSGAQRLRAFVAEHQPLVVAMAGITAYRIAFGRRTAKLGRQPEPLEGAELWIVPNPSGLNAHETIDSLAAKYAEAARAAGLL